MPSIEATLAWAVKMDAETLRAHLEAYVNLLPVINTLRLSNRFGQGPHAVIAKLPAELINNIEAHMISTERTKLYREWDKDYRCYRMYCDPDEHVTKEKFNEYLEKAKADKTAGESLIDWELEPEERVNIQLGRDFEVWADTHFTRANKWQGRTGVQSTENRGIFSKHEELIKKHFGLEVWISHERLEHGPSENFWDGMGYDTEHYDTVAFLMLPGARRISKSPRLSKDEVFEGDFHLENGYGMPISVPGPLSESDRAKFKRMMQILDLKPDFYADSFDMKLFAEDVNVRALEREYYKNLNRAAAEAAVREPKLTMLIKHVVRSDEVK